jgi:hypothetical protein
MVANFVDDHQAREDQRPESVREPTADLRFLNILTYIPRGESRGREIHRLTKGGHRLAAAVERDDVSGFVCRHPAPTPGTAAIADHSR